LKLENFEKFAQEGIIASANMNTDLSTVYSQAYELEISLHKVNMQSHWPKH